MHPISELGAPFTALRQAAGQVLQVFTTFRLRNLGTRQAGTKCHPKALAKLGKQHAKPHEIWPLRKRRNSGVHKSQKPAIFDRPSAADAEQTPADTGKAPAAHPSKIAKPLNIRNEQVKPPVVILPQKFSTPCAFSWHIE